MLPFLPRGDTSKELLLLTPLKLNKKLKSFHPRLRNPPWLHNSALNSSVSPASTHVALQPPKPCSRPNPSTSLAFPELQPLPGPGPVHPGHINSGSGVFATRQQLRAHQPLPAPGLGAEQVHTFLGLHPAESDSQGWILTLLHPLPWHRRSFSFVPFRLWEASSRLAAAHSRSPFVEFCPFNLCSSRILDPQPQC